MLAIIFSTLFQRYLFLCTQMFITFLVVNFSSLFRVGSLWTLSYTLRNCCSTVKSLNSFSFIFWFFFKFCSLLTCLLNVSFLVHVFVLYLQLPKPVTRFCTVLFKILAFIPGSFFFDRGAYPGVISYSWDCNISWPIWQANYLLCREIPAHSKFHNYMLLIWYLDSLQNSISKIWALHWISSPKWMQTSFSTALAIINTTYTGILYGKRYDPIHLT